MTTRAKSILAILVVAGLLASSAYKVASHHRKAAEHADAVALMKAARRIRPDAPGPVRMIGFGVAQPPVIPSVSRTFQLNTTHPLLFYLWRPIQSVLFCGLFGLGDDLAFDRYPDQSPSDNATRIDLFHLVVTEPNVNLRPFTDEDPKYLKARAPWPILHETLLLDHPGGRVWVIAPEEEK